MCELQGAKRKKIHIVFNLTITVVMSITINVEEILINYTLCACMLYDVLLQQ